MQQVESRLGNVLVISLAGRLDSASCAPFEQTMAARLEAGEKAIVLDLAKLEYVSSAGLRSMLVAAKKAAQASSKVVVAALSGSVAQVFEIAGFRTYFSVYATPEEAAAACA